MLKDATIVFDLDGTLVDTAPDLTNALNDVLTRRGYAPVSKDAVLQCVGNGARVMIERALERLGAEDDVDRMLEEFLVHYEANIAADSRPFPGAEQALEWLAAKGARLAVCTNKREGLSRKLLAELHLDGYFAEIAGRDTFAVSKPHPGHLLRTVERAGGKPERAIMVGDSAVDFRTARAARVPIVLVSFGYGPALAAGDAADVIIDHFSALEPTVASLLGGTMPLGPGATAQI